MPSGLKEVQASMHTVIHNLLAVNAVLLLKISIETRFNVLYDGFPAVRRVFSTLVVIH